MSKQTFFEDIYEIFIEKIRLGYQDVSVQEIAREIEGGRDATFIMTARIIAEMPSIHEELVSAGHDAYKVSGYFFLRNYHNRLPSDPEEARKCLPTHATRPCEGLHIVDGDDEDPIALAWSNWKLQFGGAMVRSAEHDREIGNAPEISDEELLRLRGSKKKDDEQGEEE